MSSTKIMDSTGTESYFIVESNCKFIIFIFKKNYSSYKFHIEIEINT